MAAQQNVKYEKLPKKSKSSKIVTNSVNEESSYSGKKLDLYSGSLCKDSESSTVSNNLSHDNLNKKEGIYKNKTRKKENVLLQNVKEVGKNFKTDSVLNEKYSEKQPVDVSVVANSSNGSEVLSKSKKRRLRKRKHKLPQVSPLLCESVDVNCEITADVKDFKNNKSSFKVASILEEADKKADDQLLVDVNKRLDCRNKLSMPLPDSSSRSLIESISVPNNCHKCPTDILSPCLEASHIYNNKIIRKSSNEVVVQSEENKFRTNEQTVTAQGLNDISHVITQTLISNDEIIQKGTSNQHSLKVDEQAKNINLHNDLSLNVKISESYSKLESTEKLLHNSALDKFSRNELDNKISKNKTETKDVTLPVQMGYSSGVLQVNDTNNTVAEIQYRNIKGISCENTSPVNATMDLNGDVAKPSSKSAKSREEVIAEREAKKAAKLAAKKAKASGVKLVSEKVNDVVDGCIIQKKPLVSGDVIIEDNDKRSSDKNLLPEINLDLKKNEESKPPSSKKPEAAGKSKAELRAERREKQEAQRAAKVAQKESGKETDKTPEKEPQKESSAKEKIIEVAVKDSEIKETIWETKYKVKLFSHLYLEKDLFQDDDCCNIHPAVLQLGAQYETRVISGSNARCLGLLHTLKKMFSDYSTPSKQEFSRGLEAMLVKSMNYLNYCRPSSVSMSNAVRHIKRHLTQLPNNIPDSEARQKLYDVIDTYIREQIDVAGEAICNTVQKKINNGDVILIYGCSSLIYRILLESHKSGTKFSVVVVDAGPWFEGREMLRRLVREGLKCSYILITAASFIMREASKVLLGAHALLANGYVMSRAGTSQVALLAHSYNVPVLVCCETHKFSERVQTDAFVYNELGDPDELVSVKTRPALQWRNYDCLTPLSIAFDVTPPDLVTAVVTELGILPCTSVPVILRIKPSEIV